MIYRDNRKGVSALEALRILTAQCNGMILSITFDRGKEFDYPRRKFGGRSSDEVHAAFLASA